MIRTKIEALVVAALFTLQFAELTHASNEHLQISRVTTVSGDISGHTSVTLQCRRRCRVVYTLHFIACAYSAAVDAQSYTLI